MFSTAFIPSDYVLQHSSPSPNPNPNPHHSPKLKYFTFFHVPFRRYFLPQYTSCLSTVQEGGLHALQKRSEKAAKPADAC